MFMPPLRFLILLFVLLAPSAATYSFEQPGILKSEFIYEIGTQPFAQSHASTIADTPRGLVVAWFGGTKEGNPDVGIWLSRHVDGKWTKPVEVANGDDGKRRLTVVNPVLFQMPNGPLMLFYKTSGWIGYVIRSSDGGATWSTPERLPSGVVGPIKNRPILLEDGSVLSPSTTLRSTDWRVYFERSTDGGKSWNRIGPLNDGVQISASYPSILVQGKGRLQAVGRTQQGRIFSIFSEDDGKTWSRMSFLDLPNPNSGTDALTLRDGRHLLVYNHSGLLADRGSGRPAGYRSPLNVAVSRDGIRWDAAIVLESEPRKEFSYPSVIQTTDGLVHVTYTYRRETIKHVVVDPSRLLVRPMVDGKWPQ
jgi:alpha-L-rhamnosidase